MCVCVCEGGIGERGKGLRVSVASEKVGFVDFSFASMCLYNNQHTIYFVITLLCVSCSFVLCVLSVVRVCVCVCVCVRVCVCVCVCVCTL